MLKLPDKSAAGIPSTKVTNRIIDAMVPLQSLFKSGLAGGPDALFETLWFKVTAPVAGQKHVSTGKLYPVEMPASFKGDFDDTQLGQLPDTDNVEIWDLDAATGGQDLAANDIWWGRHINFRDSDGKAIVMVLPTGPLATLLLKITGNATCGGIYTARIWQTPSSNIDVTASTFSTSTLGIDPGKNNAYLINLPEITLTTHDLTDTHNHQQSMYLGLRWSDATDGLPCFLCLGFWNEDCT